LGFCF